MYRLWLKQKLVGQMACPYPVKLKPRQMRSRDRPRGYPFANHFSGLCASAGKCCSPSILWQNLNKCYGTIAGVCCFWAILMKRAVLKRTTRPLKILYMLIGIVTDRPIVKQNGAPSGTEYLFYGLACQAWGENLFRGIFVRQCTQEYANNRSPRMACVLKQVTSG